METFRSLFGNTGWYTTALIACYPGPLTASVAGRKDRLFLRDLRATSIRSEKVGAGPHQRIRGLGGFLRAQHRFGRNGEEGA